MRPRPFAISVALLIALVPSLGLADTERDAARALADKANALFEAGKYQESIVFFEKAEAVFHAPTLLVRLARAHAKVGKLLEARAEYERIVNERLAAGAPREYVEAHEAATIELRDLVVRIPRLTVIVRSAPPEGASVSVDGIAIPAGEIGQPRPTNPGAHTITASAPRLEPQTRSVVSREGGDDRVEIDLLTPGAAPPADAASPGGSVVPALVAFGLAGVALGVGAITGALALGKASDLEERCPDKSCAPEDEAVADSAHSLATVSTVGFVATGVLAGVGVVLLLVRPGGASPRSTGTIRNATMKLGPGQGILEGRF